MTKTEIDVTESKIYEQSIIKCNDKVAVSITTENTKLVLFLDSANFADLIVDGALILNKNEGAA